MTNKVFTIAEEAWDEVKSLLTSAGHTVENVVQADIPVVTAWAAQFLTDEGKVILADAEIYGPQIIDGSITISDAAAKLEADLIAKGLEDLNLLKNTIFNALRTQANAVVAAV